MDSAGPSSRAATDQLDHANTSMTTDVYFGRKVLATGAAPDLRYSAPDEVPGHSCSTSRSSSSVPEQRAQRCLTEG
jgi:hypothetical protein